MKTNDALIATTEEILKDVVGKGIPIYIGIDSDGDILIVPKTVDGIYGKGKTIRQALIEFQVSYIEFILGVGKKAPGIYGFFSDLDWGSAILQRRNKKYV